MFIAVGSPFAFGRALPDSGISTRMNSGRSSTGNTWKGSDPAYCVLRRLSGVCTTAFAGATKETSGGWIKEERVPQPGNS